jgi:hypothetical protein
MTEKTYFNVTNIGKSVTKPNEILVKIHAKK